MMTICRCMRGRLGSVRAGMIVFREEVLPAFRDHFGTSFFSRSYLFSYPSQTMSALLHKCVTLLRTLQRMTMYSNSEGTKSSLKSLFHGGRK